MKVCLSVAATATVSFRLPFRANRIVFIPRERERAWPEETCWPALNFLSSLPSAVLNFDTIFRVAVAELLYHWHRVSIGVDVYYDNKH